MGDHCSNQITIVDPSNETEKSVIEFFRHENYIIRPSIAFVICHTIHTQQLNQNGKFIGDHCHSDWYRLSLALGSRNRSDGELQVIWNRQNKLSNINSKLTTICANDNDRSRQCRVWKCTLVKIPHILLFYLFISVFATAHCTYNNKCINVRLASRAFSKINRRRWCIWLDHWPYIDT